MLNRIDRSEKDCITQETFERTRALEHAAVSAKTGKIAGCAPGQGGRRRRGRRGAGQAQTARGRTVIRAGCIARFAA